MKVLLISANTEQFAMPTMPLGLFCVAEATRRAGHEVTLLDLMPDNKGEAELSQVLADFQPECIGISVRNIDDQQMASPRFFLDKIKDVAAVCRQCSQAPIVLGGAGYSIFPESVLAYLDGDFGIEGEGEIVFPLLLARLEQGGDIAALPGVLRRGHGARRGKHLCGNLDDLPLPGPETLSSRGSINPGLWVPVQTRRGCSLDCSYCSTPAIEGRLARKRSPQLVASWIEQWVQAGYRNFYFVDNTFNLPDEYAKDLCRRLRDKKLSINLQCILYPRQVDKELVALMAGAGCRQVSLGFESGSPRILAMMNKRFTLEDIRSASAMLADCGIEQMGFLLLGGPGETRESVEESLGFADSLELTSLKLTAGIRIYPNTPLAEIAARQGLFTSQADLLFPHFYLEKALDRWLPERLKKWKESRPHVMF
ncbi:MAG: radical SAM protein [Deltaproteobacteria bacterium]|nr:radical SAM protein [Deltaproteobacteria bacterium]